jgi:hypothetical protein
MPVAYVDIPAGVNHGAKKKIFQELYEEIHEAWPIPDTRVLIREWPNEAVSQDGRIENVPMRPICTLAVPPDLEHDAKKRLVRQISKTIGEACAREVEEIHLPRGTKIYNNWVLTFFWELPLDLDDSGDGRGWLLIVLCRFSAVVSGSRVSGGWRCCPMCSGGAPAPTAPGLAPFRLAGTGWLVRRVPAGHTAAASRPGMPPSRARSG